MHNDEIPHFVLRIPFGMTMKCTVILNEVKDLTDKATKNIVISNEPSGEMRDLSGDAMCCSGEGTMRFLTPCCALRSE